MHNAKCGISFRFIFIHVILDLALLLWYHIYWWLWWTRFWKDENFCERMRTKGLVWERRWRDKRQVTTFLKGWKVFRKMGTFLEKMFYDLFLKLILVHVPFFLIKNMKFFQTFDSLLWPLFQIFRLFVCINILFVKYDLWKYIQK